MSKDAFSMANDWLSFQQKYLQALGSLTTENNTQNSNAQNPFDFSSNPWSDALQHWWNSTSNNTPPPMQDFFTHIVDQGKSYFHMAEHLSNVMPSSSTSKQAENAWHEALHNTLNTMQEAFSPTSQAGPEAVRNWMGVGELPWEHWQRIFSSMSFMPGDSLQDINTMDPTRMNETIRGHLDQFASVPGVGHMRERQGQYQELYRLWSNYHAALLEYIQQHQTIGVKSVERMQSSFSHLEKEGKQLDSIRSIYDLWVDCCEEVYAESVNTDEYVEIHGNIVNALMALKRHSRMMLDEVLDTLNMPTRKEMNTLHNRFHQEWRENKKLRAELEVVKEQLAAISKPKSAAIRKTAARKSPVKKSTRVNKATTPTANKSSSKKEN